ncbi:MAG: hypothetical protein KF716_07295 [Anaerolineae bacterium]|nr:hypothetical protein [Anaerolineae bacterium]
MSVPNQFAIAQPGLFFGTYLAKVESVDDPQNLARVQVRLLNCDGVGDQDAPIWARVAAPFAGDSRGAFFIPDVDDEVLVTFVNGDPRFPIVIGSMWNGNAAPPETLGGAGDKVDRWTFVGKAGTRIAIVEEQEGSALISLTTPASESIKIKQESGGKIEIEAAGAKITLDTQGVKIEAPSKVAIQAGQVEVKAGMVKVDAAMAQFTGVVRCQTLITTTAVATTYTPGAGNIW